MEEVLVLGIGHAAHGKGDEGEGDDEAAADKLLDKLLAYRVFSDADGKMNCSVVDVAGGVLLVGSRREREHD